MEKENKTITHLEEKIEGLNEKVTKKEQNFTKNSIPSQEREMENTKDMLANRELETINAEQRASVMVKDKMEAELKLETVTIHYSKEGVPMMQSSIEEVKERLRAKENENNGATKTIAELSNDKIELNSRINATEQ